MGVKAGLGEYSRMPAVHSRAKPAKPGRKDSRNFTMSIQSIHERPFKPHFILFSTSWRNSRWCKVM